MQNNPYAVQYAQRKARIIFLPSGNVEDDYGGWHVFLE
jgi:hypothetical protein